MALSEGWRPVRNAFQSVMVGLAFDGAVPDIFSDGCVDAWETHDRSRFGYPFSQIFEPAVLCEVARLEGVAYAALATLEHRPTASIRALVALCRSTRETGEVERINLVSALVSLSRVDLAAGLLAGIEPPPSAPRLAFEVAWLRFLISNRVDDGRASPAAFEAMKGAASTGEVPPSRVLDACTQGIVWHLKRREISADLRRWCVVTGSAIVRSGRPLDAGARSAWFRGVAMVPAAARDARRTRRFMALAKEAAEGEDGRRPGRRNPIRPITNRR